jgi:Mor family transcriptional regulator
MTHRSENLKPSLFEDERPRVELRAAQKSELATVVEVLLREIAAALAKAASGERDDDQDHA